MAPDGGSVPLDRTRAIAIAQRNVCGPPGSDTASDCTVRGYERAGFVHHVVIDRGPKAAGGSTGDRVRVTLRDNGMSVNVEPIERED